MVGGKTSAPYNIEFVLKVILLTLILQQHPFQNIFTRSEYTELRNKGELFAIFVPRMPPEIIQRLGYTLMHSFGLGDLVDPVCLS
jgi:hypothetical protein